MPIRPPCSDTIQIRFVTALVLKDVVVVKEILEEHKNTQSFNPNHIKIMTNLGEVFLMDFFRIDIESSDDSQWKEIHTIFEQTSYYNEWKKGMVASDQTSADRTAGKKPDPYYVPSDNGL